MKRHICACISWQHKWNASRERPIAIGRSRFQRTCAGPRLRHICDSRKTTCLCLGDQTDILHYLPGNTKLPVCPFKVKCRKGGIAIGALNKEIHHRHSFMITCVCFLTGQVTKTEVWQLLAVGSCASTPTAEATSVKHTVSHLPHGKAPPEMIAASVQTGLWHNTKYRRLCSITRCCGQRFSFAKIDAMWCGRFVIQDRQAQQDSPWQKKQGALAVATRY